LEVSLDQRMSRPSLRTIFSGSRWCFEHPGILVQNMWRAIFESFHDRYEVQELTDSKRLPVSRLGLCVLGLRTSLWNKR
jgi:hypothetical protein